MRVRLTLHEPFTPCAPPYGNGAAWLGTQEGWSEKEPSECSAVNRRSATDQVAASTAPADSDMSQVRSAVTVALVQPGGKVKSAITLPRAEPKPGTSALTPALAWV